MGNKIQSQEKLLAENIKKQSVRTTFKISKSTKSLVDIFTEELKLSAKDVFENLTNTYELLNGGKKDVLQSAAENIFEKDNEAEKANLVARKTFVVSRGFVERLTWLAVKYKISRDILVEKAFKIYVTCALRNAEEYEEKIKKSGKLIDDLCIKVQDVGDKLCKLLDEDDPIMRRFELIATTLTGLYSDIEANIKDNKPIEI